MAAEKTITVHTKLRKATAWDFKWYDNTLREGVIYYLKGVTGDFDNHPYIVKRNHTDLEELAEYLKAGQVYVPISSIDETSSHTINNN